MYVVTNVSRFFFWLRVKKAAQIFRILQIQFFPTSPNFFSNLERFESVHYEYVNASHTVHISSLGIVIGRNAL